MSFFPWIREAFWSLAEAITGVFFPPPRRRPRPRPPRPGPRHPDPGPSWREPPPRPKPEPAQREAAPARPTGKDVSPPGPVPRPAFSLWPDATPQEAASWALYQQMRAEAGGEAPVPEAADRLPITQQDEIALLQAVERGFSFTPDGRQDLHAFLWRAAVARACEAAAQAGLAASEGEASPARAVNQALLAEPAFAEVARRLAQQADPGLDLSEIETSPLTVAACWRLMAGAVRRDPAAARAAGGALQADLKTLLDRCGSLGETHRALEPVFEALSEDPDVAPTFGATMLRLRRREVEARFS